MISAVHLRSSIATREDQAVRGGGVPRCGPVASNFLRGHQRRSREQTLSQRDDAGRSPCRREKRLLSAAECGRRNSMMWLIRTPAFRCPTSLVRKTDATLLFPPDTSAPPSGGPALHKLWPENRAMAIGARLTTTTPWRLDEHSRLAQPDSTRVVSAREPHAATSPSNHFDNSGRRNI